MIQHITKACDSAATLSTIKECTVARLAIDPSASAVKTESKEYSPKGCYRHGARWYFNTHAIGSLDGISEPVCKLTAGK